MVYVFKKLFSKNERESKFEAVFKIAAFSITVLSIVLCFIHQTLILLPIAFLLVIICDYYLVKLKLNVPVTIVYFIALIRFSILPILYTFNFDEHFYSWYAPVYVENELFVELIMITELILIFGAMFAIQKFSKNKSNNLIVTPENYGRKDESKHLVFLFFGIASLVLICIYPQLIPFLKFGRVPSNAIYAIFHVCFACFYCFITDFVSKKISNNLAKLILLIIAFVFFIIPEAIQAQSISRNVLLIVSFIFIFYLCQVFKKQQKVIVTTSVVLFIIAFCVLTARKMFVGAFETNAFLSTLYMYSNYPIANAYFAGPTNYSNGLNLINSGYYGLQYFINDTFANWPLLSSSFAENNTVYLFNVSYYHGAAQQDITPLGIQSMIYFGPMLSWLLPTVLVVLAIVIFNKAKKTMNFYILYPALYMTVVFSMSQILSWNAVSMLMILRAVPVLIIVVVDKMFDLLIEKISSKVKRKRQIPVSNIQSNSLLLSGKLEPFKKKIGVNYIFSLIHQIVLFATPLVLTPYISSVFGPSGIGEYNFSYSINYYFVLVANLGFTYYAQREIAKNQDDKLKTSTIFFEIIICKIIMAFLSSFVYFAIISSNLFKDYNSLLLILSINILSVAFDCSFVFKGKENFVVLSIVQSLVKIASVILIFLLVKSKNDLPIYTLIMSLYSLLSVLALLPFLKTRLCKIKLKELKFWRHLLPSVFLFIPLIAGFFYTSFLKTIIGLMVKGDFINEFGDIIKNSDIQNGYFSQADKIVQMGLSIITALGAVYASRNADAFEKKDLKQFKSNLNTAVCFVFALGLPICCGIISISRNIVPWFMGDTFLIVENILAYYPVLIMISGLGNVFGLQCLISSGQDKKVVIGTIAGAVTSIALGFPLIHFIGAFGAAITSIVSELVVLIIYIIFCRKYISFFEIIKTNYKYVIASVLMMLFVFYLSSSLQPSIVNSLLIIILGCVVYAGCLILLKDNYVYIYFKKIYLKCFGDGYVK